MAVIGFIGSANAEIVTFEDQTGPTLFGNPNQTLTYTFGTLTVTFTGGTILTNAENLPVDHTSVYGSISGINSNPITMTFSQPVNNFFVDLLNGDNQTMDYTIADNAGHSAMFTLLPNFQNGLVDYSIPATGSQVTITSDGTGFFDFLIDNVGFNQPTPAPEPLTLSLFGAAVAGAAAMRRRRKASKVA